MDQIVRVPEKAVARVGEVPRHLGHPSSSRIADDARDLDSPRLQIDDEQHQVTDEAPRGQYLNAEEVRGRDRAPMRSQESLPRHRPRALARGRCRGR